jgi:hypothetical protein
LQVVVAPLTHARIAKFYIPLAMSWVFMALESPICVAVVSRLPAPELNTAAFLILMSVALFIESPIIDLLSTSTTLSKNHHDFAVLSKFVWILIAITAIAHTLMVLTPLYWVITRTILGVPLDVARHARFGLAFMIPWAPSIAWRRYRQGLLIRFHQTRMVGFGTAVRVTTIATVNLLLYFFTHLSGAEVVGLALVCAVFAEALFAHFASRSVVRAHLSPDSTTDAVSGPLLPVAVPTSDDELAGEPLDILELDSLEDSSRDSQSSSGNLTMARLVRFHMPLTLTTMVALIGSPIISAFLSKATDPVLALASWQVAFSLLWLFRTITFALPEVVITLYKNKQTAQKLRDFCIYVGIATSAIALFVAGSRLDVWFFSHVYESTPKTAELAHVAFFAAAPLGFINSMQSYVRGMLTAHHLNVARFAAVIAGMITMVGALVIGLYTPWRGVLSGAIAMNLGLISELAVLAWSWRKGSQTRPALSQASG